VLRFINERIPPSTASEYVGGQTVFALSGDLEKWRHAKVYEPLAADSALQRNVELLKYEHRFEDARKLIDESQEQSTRVVSLSPNAVAVGVGRRPKSAECGWLNLALSNASAAAEDGRRVLHFVANEPKTKWNEWLSPLLAAEGSLFIGDKEQAIREADGVLTIFPRSRDAITWNYVAARCARIYAWAGADDKAIDLLEVLTTAVPGIGPAQLLAIRCTRCRLQRTHVIKRSRRNSKQKLLRIERCCET